MTIPALLKPQGIEHVFRVGGQNVRVTGTSDLDSRTLTASATLLDGRAIEHVMGAPIKRELTQIYGDYKIVLQY